MCNDGQKRFEYGKLVLLFIAIVNFAFIYSHTSSYKYQKTGTLSFCYICPWYEEAPFGNVSLLLLAAILLLFRNRIINWISVAVSGYLALWGAHFVFWKMNFLMNIQYMAERYATNPSEIFLEYELQLILAIVMFAGGVFYARRSATADVIP